MSSPQFDPNIIERYAEQLYRKADSVRVGSAITGAVLGVVFGGVPISPVGAYLPIPSTFGLATILLGAILGAFLGYAIGEGRAFRIRLQAQLVLFQLQLERNTSAATVQAAAPASAEPVAQPRPAVVVAPAQVAVPPLPRPAAIPEPVIPVLPAQRPTTTAVEDAPPRFPLVPEAVEPPPAIAPPPLLAPRPLVEATPAAAEDRAPPQLPPLSPSRSS
jgi:hypothetical protein